jgi:hypothetical protein
MPPSPAHSLYNSSGSFTQMSDTLPFYRAGSFIQTLLENIADVVVIGNTVLVKVGVSNSYVTSGCSCN